MMHRKTICFSLGLCLSMASQALLARPAYRLIDLGTFGGVSVYANAINDSGQVVGSAVTKDGETIAILKNYNAKPIKISPGFQTPQAGALGINNSGVVVGTVQVPGDHFHTFTYQNGNFSDLGAFGGESSRPAGINDQGRLAIDVDFLGSDEALTANAQGGAVIWLPPPYGNSSWPTGINNAGQVVGTMEIPNVYAPRGFVTRNGTLVDIGTLGGQSSSPSAINDAGQVVGAADTSAGDSHAFLYRDGRMIDLTPVAGTLSQANAINSSGQVVGSMTSASSPYRPFLYSSGELFDLTTLVISSEATKGVLLYEATGINSNGWILATGGYASSFNTRAYLLLPVPAAPSNLSARTGSAGEISLSWTPSTDAARYVLKEGEASGQESAKPIASKIRTTSFTLTSLISGQLYCFTVSAASSNGVGLPSNETCLNAP